MKELTIGTILHNTVNGCSCKITNIWVDMSLEIGTVWVELTMIKGDTEKFKTVSNMRLSRLVDHINDGKVVIV